MRSRTSRLLRALCALVALTILGSGVPAAAEGENTVYASSFIAGVDGWYARGAQQVYRTTEATLRVTGRESDWHSPGRNFELAAGAEYTLSAEVYQDETDSAEFMISVAHSSGGVESYVTHYNGVSLRVVRGYDMQHKREMLSMDVLYGFKTLYPELAVRALG